MTHMQVQLFAFCCLVQCLVKHDHKWTHVDFGYQLFFNMLGQSKFGHVSCFVSSTFKCLYKHRLWKHGLEHVFYSLIWSVRMMVSHRIQHPDHFCFKCWCRATSCANVRWWRCWLWICHRNILGFNIFAGSGKSGAETGNRSLLAALSPCASCFANANPPLWFPLSQVWNSFST